MEKTIYLILFLSIFIFSCKNEKAQEFPSELVNFIPLKTDSVFAGTGEDTRDKMIRERGFILKEENAWRLWYTGYNKDNIDTHFLGLATSIDGINWKRHHDNPIFSEIWLAKSTDLKEWKNVVDDPVITTDTELYDKYAVAINHIIKYKKR